MSARIDFQPQSDFHSTCGTGCCVDLSLTPLPHQNISGDCFQAPSSVDNWQIIQAMGLMGTQASKGKRKGEEDDYMASNMKFDEQDFEQLMLEAQNMDKVLRGEKVSTFSTVSSLHLYSSYWQSGNDQNG